MSLWQQRTCDRSAMREEKEGDDDAWSTTPLPRFCLLIKTCSLHSQAVVVGFTLLVVKALKAVGPGCGAYEQIWDQLKL